VRGGRVPEPARKSIILPIIVLALLIAGGLAVYLGLEKSAPPPPPPPAPQSEAMAQPEAAPSPRPVAPVAGDHSAPPPRATTPKTSPLVSSVPADAASPQQLLSSLAQIDGKSQITPDQAKAWKESLQQLVRQGPAAVPAIQFFMAQNLDTNYAGVGGADQLGYSSLRAGMIDALAQIGGPEATAAMLQILQSSIYPTDIAQLARSMGSSATGQYQQEFLGAVRQQLFQASQGQQANNADVGPLFQVLAAEAANGAQVAQDIQQYGSKWAFYSAITLANLPDGAGLPALVQMAQTSDAGQTVAVDSLAQLAPGSPQALNSLLELAKSGQLPDYVMQSVAPFLAGQQFALSSDSNPAPAGAQLQTIHMANGNQNFIAYQASTPAQIGQQIHLIDQLIQVLPPSDSDTLLALQQQKGALSSKLGK